MGRRTDRQYAELQRTSALIDAASAYHRESYALAMAGLQSDLYHSDPDFRDAVDNVLAIWRGVEEATRDAE